MNFCSFQGKKDLMHSIHYQCALVSSNDGAVLKKHHWFLLLAGCIFKSSSNSIKLGEYEPIPLDLCTDSIPVITAALFISLLHQPWDDRWGSLADLNQLTSIWLFSASSVFDVLCWVFTYDKKAFTLCDCPHRSIHISSPHRLLYLSHWIFLLPGPQPIRLFTTVHESIYILPLTHWS